MASPMPRPEFAESAAEAVAGILACADVAVGAIGRSAEQQVLKMTAEVEARPAEEALRRREQLTQLRGELAERAAALALSYGSILDQLGQIDAMLAGERPAADAADADPRVAAIRMTLRERRRVHAPAEAETAQVGTPAEGQAQQTVPAAEPVPAGPWVASQGGAVAQDTTWPPAQPAPAPAPQSWPVEQPAQSWQAEHQVTREWQVAPPAPQPQAGYATPPVPAQPSLPVQPEAPVARRRSWRLWQRAA